MLAMDRTWRELDLLLLDAQPLGSPLHLPLTEFAALLVLREHCEKACQRPRADFPQLMLGRTLPSREYTRFPASPQGTHATRRADVAA